jgi:hypothetical protein
MSNWYGTARSNYFSVKDRKVFEDWALEHNLKVFNKIENGNSTFAIAPNDTSDSGGWPSEIYDEESEDYKEFDLVLELSDLIEPEINEVEQIIVLEEIGAEKLRYLTANAVAFNCKGDYINLNLDEIYKQASKKFKVPISEISSATY